MITRSLKNSFLISLMGHFTVFGLFGFSFGERIIPYKQANVAFWGGVLKNYDLAPETTLIRRAARKSFFVPPAEVPSVENTESQEFKPAASFVKPPVSLIREGQQKVTLKNDILGPVFLAKRKKPVVMFYPELPYDFNLYFKDRQVAHIELEYIAFSPDKNKSVLVRRKASSGNLEVDLFCMHYIEQYLSIQKYASSDNIWQTVKIELEPNR
ncbi:MAG: hypothetical protein FJZ15_00335 [Candidatus Omnitrophica bacterium]|nr:hypothetical protein [Candidatus Omnitrophota bacterium]